MEEFTIRVEDRGSISVEVENNTPNVSLLPSEGSIEVNQPIQPSPSVEIVHTENPINVHKVTHDLYIIDEDDIGKLQKYDLHEITEEEAIQIMDEIDNGN